MNSSDVNSLLLTVRPEEHTNFFGNSRQRVTKMQKNITFGVDLPVCTCVFLTATSSAEDQDSGRLLLLYLWFARL